MAIKKEEFQALVEREGVMDFIWSRTWEDIEGTEIGLYELASDRWGVVFQIFPPFYAMQATEQKLSTFFGINLPEKSSIQFFMFTSRNMEYFKRSYENIHKNPGQLHNPDVLNELADNRIDWIEKYKNESLFKNKGIDFRLRNYVNLCAVTIPKKNKQGNEITRSEVINIFSRVFTGLSDFAPKKFRQADYVALMREILVPDSDIWSVEEDHKTYLNNQVVDNNSVMVIEEKDETLGIGKLISKEEYDKLQRKDTSEDIDDEEYEEDEGFLSGLKKLFEKKKEDEEERTAYTKWHAKAYTTKIYPAHVNLFSMLSNFVDFYGNQIETEIPSTFFSSLTVYIEDKEKIKKEVIEKTQWNLWQTKSLGDSARFFPEIVDRAKESEAINQMLNKGQVPMSAMWSLVVMDDSLTNVQKYGERIKKKFMETNWVLQEETVIPHWVFLYSLPLQFEKTIMIDHSKRMNTLFTQNCASIAPLMTGEKGFGSPVLLYVDRAGQLAGVDIFASETNYNFIVVGSSGSGKSYTMADFFMNYLMTGAKVRVIDVGRSYKHLCSLIGGQYIEFTEEAAICLNFFTHIELNDAGQIHEDEIQTIVPLIGLMAMQSLDPEDANNNIEIPVVAGYISQAVTMAFETRHRNAGMQDVVLSLEKILADQKNNTGETDRLLHSLITALYPFGNPKGEYYKYFNGVNNLKFESDFVVLELEEIDSNAHLKSVILAAIAHIINTEFFLGAREQRKILAIDEAWSIMDNKIVIRFLETMARRIRKYNGASGVITQTIGDFYKNKATRAIFDSSATKIFLKQSGESIAAAEGKGELNLDKGIINLMSTVTSKPPMFSELLIKQDNGSFFISRLITDKLAHWIYTNHPKDMAIIYDIMREFGITELDAKIIKGYSDKNKTTIEEEFNRRLKEGLLSIGASGDIDKLSNDNELEQELDNL